MTFGIGQSAHAEPSTDLPSVGEQLPMAGGSPAALSAANQLTSGLAPVVDNAGVVLASTLGKFQARLAPSQAKSKTGGAAAAASACTPFTGVDNPHVSGSEFVASGHGWWRKGTCSGSKATVTTCLLEWWVGNDGQGRWVTKKCQPGVVKAAPSGTRKPSVTARVGCTNRVYTGWANVVDVDVSGVVDTGETSYRTANIYCRRLS